MDDDVFAQEAAIPVSPPEQLAAEATRREPLGTRLAPAFAGPFLARMRSGERSLPTGDGRQSSGSNERQCRRAGSRRAWRAGITWLLVGGRPAWNSSLE
jgi:hypothetical protein